MIILFTYFVYLALLFFVVFLTKIASLKQKKLGETFEITQTTKLSIYHIMALLLISFVVGFRFNVGVDWEGYKKLFETISYFESMASQDTYMEWGFFMINKLLAGFNVSYAIMFFTVALLSWYFFFKSVPAVLLPLVVYFLFTDEFFFSSMNLVRQYVAIGIFLYSIKFIIKRNLKVFLFLIAVATLFHISAFLLIVFYFIPYEKLYNQKFWMIAFVTSFFFNEIPFLVNGLQSVFVRISNYFPIMEIYLRYFSFGSYKYEIEEVNIGAGFIFRIIIALFILLFSKNVIKRYPQTTIYFILYFLGAIFFNVFYTIKIVVRFLNYFLIMRTIALALVVYYLWHYKKYRALPVAIICLYFILYLVLIYSSSNMCSPFQFVFMQ